MGGSEMLVVTIQAVQRIWSATQQASVKAIPATTAHPTQIALPLTRTALTNNVATTKVIYGKFVPLIKTAARTWSAIQAPAKVTPVTVVLHMPNALVFIHFA